MATEFELKYAATAANLEAIRAAVPGQYETISMETTYYDTPGHDLSARKWTLRRRLENGVSVCTLKTPASGSSRNEWEVECKVLNRNSYPHQHHNYMNNNVLLPGNLYTIPFYSSDFQMPKELLRHSSP